MYSGLKNQDKIFFNKLKFNGKHTMVIIEAIMRKLLHMCVTIIKSNASFNDSASNS